MTGFAEYQPAGHGTRRDVTVRAAVAEDVETMAAIQREAGRAAHTDHWLRAVDAAETCVVVAIAAIDGVTTLLGWAQTSWWPGASDTTRDPAPSGHYLGGVTIHPEHRRQGAAAALTQARMTWLGERTDEVFYVVNPRNRASIDLHAPWGFTEIARGPLLTGVTFEGGTGLLLRAELSSRAAPPPATRRAAQPGAPSHPRARHR